MRAKSETRATGVTSWARATSYGTDCHTGRHRSHAVRHGLPSGVEGTGATGGRRLEGTGATGGRRLEGTGATGGQRLEGTGATGG